LTHQEVFTLHTKELHTVALGLGDQIRERDFQCCCQLEQVSEAWISQAALDLTDVSSVHSGKVSQPLLRETIDFAPPRANRFTKSL